MPKNAGCPAVSTRPGLSHTPRGRLHSPTRFPPGPGEPRRGERAAASFRGTPDSPRSSRGCTAARLPPQTTRTQPRGSGMGRGWGRHRVGEPPSSPPGHQPGLGAAPSPAPEQHCLRQLPLPAPPLHPFPCAPGTHPGRSQLPEALKGQLGVGRPAHLVRSPGGSHQQREGSGRAVPREPRGEIGFWTLRLSGSCGEAGEVQVEGMTWAGDLGHRAGEGCPGPQEQMLRAGDSLGGGVCMRIPTVVY